MTVGSRGFRRKIASLLVFLLVASQLFTVASAAEGTPQVVSDAIQGIVQDDNNSPIEGATVTAYEVDMSGIVIDPNAGIVRTTDVNGQYNFDSLTEGYYQLEASKTGFATQIIKGLIVRPNNTYSGMDIKLGSAAVQGFTGKVMKSGQVLSGVQVNAYLQQTNNSFLAEPDRTVLTDPSGSYNLLGLNNGNYRLDFIENGASSPFQSSMLMVESNTLRFNDVFFTGIEGVVSDFQSNAIAGVLVKFFKWDENANNYSIDAGSVSTSDTGYYKAALPPGNYKIEYSKETYMTSYVEVANLQYSQLLTIDQPIGTSASEVHTGIAGMVFENFMPASGATVEIYKSSPSPDHSLVTSADGKYQFDLGSYFPLESTSPVTIGLKIVKEGFAPVTKTITLDPNTWLIDGMTMLAPGSAPAAQGIEGMVKNDQDQPVVNVQVQVWNGTDLIGQGTTGADGYYQVELPPGVTYTVTYSLASTEIAAANDVQVVADEYTIRDVVLSGGTAGAGTPGGTTGLGIFGMVQDADGNAVQADIEVYSGSNVITEPLDILQSTDSNGEFFIPLSAAGPYTLFIQPEIDETDMNNPKGYVGEAISVQFDGSSSVNLDPVQLDQGTIYTGKVVNHSGSGVSGSFILAVAPGDDANPTQVFYMAESATDGSFEVVVPSAGYTTDQLELWIIADFSNLDLNNLQLQVVAFPASGTDFGTIELQYEPVSGTVTGRILKADGITPIPNAWFQYAKLDSAGAVVPGSKVGEATNPDGNFGFSPNEPGSYKIVEVEISQGDEFKRIPLDYSFSLDANFNLFDHAGNAADSLAIALPMNNFTATFTEKGTPAVNAWVEIVDLNEKSSFYSKTNSEGQISLILKPGNYKIGSIGNEKFWQELDTAFTIVDGEQEILDINLAGNANVTIKITKDGEAVSTTYGVSVGSETDYELHFHKDSNAQGEAYFELPPGNYKIFGISDHANEFQWIHLDQAFTVTESDTQANPLEVVIDLKDPNVTGTVKDKSGLTVANAWIQFREKTNDFSGKFYGANSDQNGVYRIFLPAGTYIVEGYHLWNQDTQTGKFVQIGKEVSVPAEGNTTIDIQEAVPNLQGIIYMKDQETAWSDVDVIFEPLNLGEVEQPWLYEKRTRTDQDGRYEINLPEGDYKLKAISTYERWVEMGNSFTVSVGSDGSILNSTGFTIDGSDYNVIPPAANVKGMIVNFGGSRLTLGENEHAWVNIHEQWDPSSETQPRHFGAELESDGSFELTIDSSGTYILEGVGQEVVNSDGTRSWQHTQLNIEFQHNGTTLYDFGEIGPNVRGTAVLTGETIDGIIIRPAINEADLDDTEKQNLWKLDKWAQVDSNDNFQLYLKPGNYKVLALSGPGTWVEVGQEFTVASGQPLDLNVTVSTNVTGSVKDAIGASVADAWVEIRQGTGPDEKHYGTRTDENGLFKTNLPVGEYVVRGVHQWNQATETGKFIPLNYAFKVVDVTGGTAMQTMDGAVLSSIDIQPNVIGAVKKSLTDGTALPNAWVTIKPAADTDQQWENAIWAESDSNGVVTMSLAPGSYKVVDIGSSSFWKRVDIQFTVNANGALAASQGFEAHVVNGQLLIAPPAPNLKGVVKKKDGTVAAQAWISIRPSDAKPDEWDQFRHFNTDDNGEFEGSLETNKDYVAVSIGGQDFWEEVNIPFSISASGVLTGSTVAAGKLVVAPPTPNVKGSVEAADGEPIANGWISFKPADAAEHDWQNARWTETNDKGEFEIYLAAGEYVIPHAGNGSKWVDPKLKFTVEADGSTITSNTSGAVVNNQLVVQPPQPNVSGTMYKETTGNVVVGNGYISIVKINGSNQVLDHNGDVALDKEGQPVTLGDRENIWQHTYWFNTDSSGQFGMFLDDAQYYVLHAGGPATDGEYVNYEPGIVFTVDNGVSDQDPMNIRPPGDNFTGTISGLIQDELDKEFVQYWVKVVDANDIGKAEELQKQWWIPVEDDQDANTVGTGNFAAALPLGEYEIKGIATPFGMEDLDAGQVTDNSGITFTISTSGTVNKPIELGGNSVITIKGKVTNGGSDISNTIVTVKLDITNTTDDTVETKLIQTDSNGIFAFKVKSGFTYDIDQVITDEFIDVTVPTVDINYNEANLLTVDFTVNP